MFVPRARKMPAGSVLRIDRLKLIHRRPANNKPDFLTRVVKLSVLLMLPDRT